MKIFFEVADKNDVRVIETEFALVQLGGMDGCEVRFGAPQTRVIAVIENLVENHVDEVRQVVRAIDLGSATPMTLYRAGVRVPFVVKCELEHGDLLTFGDVRIRVGLGKPAISGLGVEEPDDGPMPAFMFRAPPPEKRAEERDQTTVPPAEEKRDTVTPTKPEDLLVFLDLETTGLDPKGDRILEIAILVTRSDLSTPTPPREGLPNSFGAHIVSDKHPEDLIPDEYVRKMHEESGLLALVCVPDVEKALAERAVAEPGTVHGRPWDRATPWIERRALAFMRAWGFSHSTKATLCGFGPHFDLAFLKAHMPALARLFHYRLIDVTALVETAARWTAPDIRERMTEHGEKRGLTKHRAMSDCLMAADTLGSFYGDAIALQKTIETEARLGDIESAISDVIAAAVVATASQFSAAGAPPEAVERVLAALENKPDKE